MFSLLSLVSLTFHDLFCSLQMWKHNRLALATKSVISYQLSKFSQHAQILSWMPSEAWLDDKVLVVHVAAEVVHLKMW